MAIFGRFFAIFYKIAKNRRKSRFLAPFSAIFGHFLGFSIKLPKNPQNRGFSGFLGHFSENRPKSQKSAKIRKIRENSENSENSENLEIRPNRKIFGRDTNRKDNFLFYLLSLRSISSVNFQLTRFFYNVKKVFLAFRKKFVLW